MESLRIKARIKLFLRDSMNLDLPSFCKECGRDVHDFIAPDDIWNRVDEHIKLGHVLCYDCFCEMCGFLGLPEVWNLTEPKAQWTSQRQSLGFTFVTLLTGWSAIVFLPSGRGIVVLTT